MKLYLVEIGTGHLKYKHLSDDLNLNILNKLLRKEESLINYPILNNNDIRLIENSGGTIVLNEKKQQYWIINIDEQILFERKFREMVRSILLAVKRDMKLESLSN